MNPFRPWEKDEQQTYQRLLNFYYDRFVHIVVQSRPKLEKEKLVNNLGADVFPAPLAYEHGYVDGVGLSREQVLKELASAANIVGDYQVVAMETQHWWKKLIQSQSALFSGKIIHEFKLPGDLQANTRYPCAYLYK